MTEGRQAKRQMLRNAEYYDMTEVFDRLYSDSLKGKTFTNLMEVIESENNILMAYRSIKKNSGSYTPGTDGKTIADIANMDTATFITVVRNKLRNYHPKPVKRVEIPKQNGKMRPLGIPTIMDRVVQQSILQVMEPVCEPKFHERSNGFRPNRSCETAIAQCHRMMELSNLSFVVDVDIKGFFDNVNHGKLLKQIWTMGIRDKNLICVISKMLKAPIQMPDGSSVNPVKGTPQGGILSPLLSNIVLNELDQWITSQWEAFPTRRKYPGTLNKNGVEKHGNKYRAQRTSRLKEMYIVRYADDFKIFCANYQDAQRVKIATVNWLKERLSLEISEEKTRIVNLRKKATEFLGFRLRLVRKGRRYAVESHMCDKAIENAVQTLQSAIKKIATPKNEVDEQRAIEKYNAKVIGIHNYFCIATHICKDCDKIAWRVNGSMRHRVRQRLKRQGKQNGYVYERYGKSKQLRYIAGRAVAPIGYAQTRKPLDKKRSVNKFTPEGRVEIHRSLEAVDMQKLIWLACNPIQGRSTEYNDNRVSLYAAQKGKCAISGLELDVHEVHCHHADPQLMEKRDRYSNLVIIHPYVHRLIHLKDETLIREYLEILKLDSKQIKKLNLYREKAGNKKI